MVVTEGGILSQVDLSIFKSRVGCVISNLPFTEEQRDVFDEVMEENKVEYPTINVLRIMRDEWHLDARITSLKTHRAKECVCYARQNLPDTETK